jgi:hypothetical protein
VGLTGSDLGLGGSEDEGVLFVGECSSTTAKLVSKTILNITKLLTYAQT